VAAAQSYAHGDALVDSAIRENIHQSASDALARSQVLRDALQEGKLTVMEVIYHLDTGEVERLGKSTGVEPDANSTTVRSCASNSARLIARDAGIAGR
jgi:carbonic anhydrase